MFTLETEADVTAEGELSLTVRVPQSVSSGRYRIVIVIEDEPFDPYTSAERARTDALAAGIDWDRVVAASRIPQSWFEETEDPFAPPEQPETTRPS